nr:uncharacterized protein LOC127310514 [Lolium perenne]
MLISEGRGGQTAPTRTPLPTRAGGIFHRPNLPCPRHRPPPVAIPAAPRLPSTRAGRRELPAADPRLPPPAIPRHPRRPRIRAASPAARPPSPARPPPSLARPPRRRRPLAHAPASPPPRRFASSRAAAARVASSRAAAAAPSPPGRLRVASRRRGLPRLRPPARQRLDRSCPNRPPLTPMDTDDTASLSDDSGWPSSDDSDIEELLQDDDVEMMSLLIDVQEFEDRKKLMDQRRGSKMGRVTIYRNRALGHEQLMHDYFAKITSSVVDPPPVQAYKGWV